MNILIKSAKIIDPESEFNETVQDILVENGLISNIGLGLDNPNNYKEITFENLHISQGWFDSSVSFGEPGFEERETIANGIKTAALSGFTAVGVNSNTNPIIDSSTHVAFIKSKSYNSPVDLYPIGALTKQSKGEDLAELFDMKNSGAKAFYDYKKTISNPNLLKIALQYSSNFGGLVCSFPQENKIAGSGVMNENITSTSLGLKGNPALAEEMQVARDLFLLEYTGGKLHIPTISTAKSVALIKAAKAKKLDVSCSVAIHNLVFTDESLTGFDTRFKVTPPLRTQADIDALIAGVLDGTVDMVTSDHNPLDIELKKIEFDHAAYGSIGLESAFGALLNIFSLNDTVKLLTMHKKRFGISSNPLQIGEPLSVTLFNPEGTHVFSEAHILSKSKNTIFKDYPLKGHVYGIISNNSSVLK
jgi:dihydroorotase